MWCRMVEIGVFTGGFGYFFFGFWPVWRTGRPAVCHTNVAFVRVAFSCMSRNTFIEIQLFHISLALQFIVFAYQMVNFIGTVVPRGVCNYAHAAWQHCRFWGFCIAALFAAIVAGVQFVSGPLLNIFPPRLIPWFGGTSGCSLFLPSGVYGMIRAAQDKAEIAQNGCD